MPLKSRAMDYLSECRFLGHAHATESEFTRVAWVSLFLTNIMTDSHVPQILRTPALEG